jgi:histidine kinase-like protein
MLPSPPQRGNGWEAIILQATRCQGHLQSNQISDMHMHSEYSVLWSSAPSRSRGGRPQLQPAAPDLSRFRRINACHLRNPEQSPRVSGIASNPATGLRWRQLFPGEERQLGVLRRWLAALLPDCAARDDVVSVAVELATNAVKFTASGHGGWFAVELTWSGRVVRVAVVDGGAPAAPHLVDDPTGEHGRGLLMVRALSARTGVCGDGRGRLVWAEIAWSGEGAAQPGMFPTGYEAAMGRGQAALARPVREGADLVRAFHPAGMAMTSRAGGALLTAPSAGTGPGTQPPAALAIRAGAHGGTEPGAARAGHRASAPATPVPLRIHRARPRGTRLGTAPC